MYYNVAQLLKEPMGATRMYSIDEPFASPDKLLGLLHLEGTMQMLRTHRGVLVTAALATTVQEECSRCLEGYPQPLDLQIEEEFFPVADVASGLPVEMPAEAGPFLISPQHILDLQEAVRQACLLAKPLQPLCGEDCAGLCPECGQNLSQGMCKCRKESVDPRWAPLRELAS